MLGRIRSQFQFYKDRARISMFGSIWSDLQCFEGQDQNSNVYRNSASIQMFGRIRSENQCVQKKGKYLSIWKDKIRITIFIKIGPVFLCLEG